MRISACKFCGTVLLGKETHGVCCGKKKPSGVGITFKRKHDDAELQRIYSLRAFQTKSVQVNSLFASVLPYMDLSFARGCGPSFMRIQGLTSVALPLPDSRYSFLWSDSAPSLQPGDYRSNLLRRAVQSEDVKAMVPELYNRIQPQQSIVRARYRSLVNAPQHPAQDTEQPDDDEDTANQGVEIQNYSGSQTGTVVSAARTGPQPEDQPGRPSYMQATVVEPAGLYTSEAPVAQIVAGSETHSGPNGQRVVKMKRLKPSSRQAECGAFPLLYPYGDNHEPFDITEYIDNKKPGALDNETNPHIRELKKMTWAEFSKRRLYTDNMLLNSGTLLQQWMLRTVLGIEDMRLQFLERDQRNRLVAEQELIESGGNLDGASGRLFLPDSHLNSPAYWKQKRLDVQALVARVGPPSLFITVTMNPWNADMGRLGLDIEHRNTFTPHADKPRVFDRPDLVARAYNQHINEILHELETNSEEYFGRKCLAIAAKLEFQQRNTPHHHILLWLEGGVLETCRRNRQHHLC